MAILGNNSHHHTVPETVVQLVSMDHVAKLYALQHLQWHRRDLSMTHIFMRAFGVSPDNFSSSDQAEPCIVLPGYKPGIDIEPGLNFEFFEASDRTADLSRFRKLWERPNTDIESFAAKNGSLLFAIIPRPEPLRFWRTESFLFDVFVRGLKVLSMHRDDQDFLSHVRKALARHWSESQSIFIDGFPPILRDFEFLFTGVHRSPPSKKREYGAIDWELMLEAYVAKTLYPLYQPKFKLQHLGLRFDTKHLLGTLYGQVIDQVFAPKPTPRPCPICGARMEDELGKPLRKGTMTCRRDVCRKRRYLNSISAK